MTNSKNQNTTIELGFPIFEGQNHPHEKQFNFINNKISLMEKFKTESTNKELCEFIVVLESNDYFDFYSYQKQNLNTNYCFFTPEDSKHCGYTGREVSIKSKSDLNFKIQHVSKTVIRYRTFSILLICARGSDTSQIQSYFKSAIPITTAKK